MSFDPFFVVLLAPAVPLVAALWGRVPYVVGSIFAWVAAIASLFLGAGEALRLTLELNTFALLMATAAGYVAGTPMEAMDAALEATRTESTGLKRSHKELKEAVSRQEKDENRAMQIYGVSKSLSEALSWSDMAPRLSSGIQKLFGAYEYLLYSIGQDGSWTCLQRRGGWSKEPPLTEAAGLAPYFVNPPNTSEVVPLLVVPVPAESAGATALAGLLFLKGPQSASNDDELLQVASEFAEQIRMALSKAVLFARIETQSRTDGLTGLLRRQAFMDRFHEEMKKASAFKTPMSVLMVDIDHFKAVNDGHGHAAGDAVLGRVGSILKSSVYETDVVGRYGGEEFIMLLPRAQADGVRRKAEAIRSAIEGETVSAGFERLSVTVSIGVAHYVGGAESVESLIARADKALYEAKHRGRNRVVEL